MSDNDYPTSSTTSRSKFSLTSLSTLLDELQVARRSTTDQQNFMNISSEKRANENLVQENLNRNTLTTSRKRLTKKRPMNLPSPSSSLLLAPPKKRKKTYHKSPTKPKEHPRETDTGYEEDSDD